MNTETVHNLRTALPTDYSIEQVCTHGRLFRFHYVVVDRRHRHSAIVWHGEGISPEDRNLAEREIVRLRSL